MTTMNAWNDHLVSESPSSRNASTTVRPAEAR